MPSPLFNFLFLAALIVPAVMYIGGVIILMLSLVVKHYRLTHAARTPSKRWRIEGRAGNVARLDHPGRQRGVRAGCVSTERRHRHLPDHALIRHGGVG